MHTVSTLDSILLLPASRLDSVLSALRQVIAQARAAATSRASDPSETIQGLALLVVTAERIGPYGQADPLIQPLLLEAAPQEEWMVLDQAFQALAGSHARLGESS